MGTSISAPLRSTRAVVGASSASSRTAREGIDAQTGVVSVFRYRDGRQV
jgi:hypothetical protein